MTARKNPHAVAIAATPAPRMPLNLRLDTLYAPPRPNAAFVAYEARDYGQRIVVLAYHPDGTAVPTFDGATSGAWHALAAHLRMDIEAAR